MSSLVPRGYIVAFNVLFMALSMLFYILGMVLRFGWNLLKPVFSQALATPMIDATSLGFETIVKRVGNVSMSVGAVMFFVCLLGCVGACWNFQKAINAYATLVSLVIAAEIALLVLLFATDMFKNILQVKLKVGIEQHYTGFNGTDATTISWNFMMTYLECCGAKDISDFDQTRRFNTATRSGTPIACCKFTSKFPDLKRPVSPKCYKYPTKDNSNRDRGCVDAIIAVLQHYSGVYIGLITTFFMLEITLLGMVLWIKKKIKDKRLIMSLYGHICNEEPGYFLRELSDMADFHGGKDMPKDRKPLTRDVPVPAVQAVQPT